MSKIVYTIPATQDELTFFQVLASRPGGEASAFGTYRLRENAIAEAQRQARGRPDLTWQVEQVN